MAQEKGATYVITAAGGNGTAIEVLPSALTREEYASRGRALGLELEPKGAEQTGFLIPSDSHFEMAGGEFCGNATRAAALLLSEQTGKGEVDFTVSGFSGRVTGKVERLRDTTYRVTCVFPGMALMHEKRTLDDGTQVDVVDLGGIVHVAIEAPMPEDYVNMHERVRNELGLTDRPAVGVIWYEREKDAVRMHPVAWVKEVDTLFYEQSSGSGAIAIAKVTGESRITQPTGDVIEVRLSPGSVKLESDVEIAYRS